MLKYFKIDHGTISPSVMVFLNCLPPMGTFPSPQNLDLCHSRKKGKVIFSFNIWCIVK